MGCLEAMKPEVLLSRCSFAEAREYIKKHVIEYYEVEPGYKIHDVHLIGVPPLYVGIEAGDVIFPYTKPCHGTFVVKVVAGEDVIERLRSRRK